MHEHWPDNLFVTADIRAGDIDAAARAASVRIEHAVSMGRHAGVSIETRGVLAHHDRRLDEFVVYSSTQFPHVIRTILARALGLPESRLRVIAPDVGGGFGPKNNFQPEE
ncbi:MAG: molybdopterin cofactor-binding domain-containing protein, partial [bacterium]